MHARERHAAAHRPERTPDRLVSGVSLERGSANSDPLSAVPFVTRAEVSGFNGHHRCAGMLDNVSEEMTGDTAVKKKSYP